MSIDTEKDMTFVTPPHERVEDQVERGNGLSFADAAELSHGPYDTPEQRTERIERAIHLAETMQVGAPVLHQIGQLEVQAGILVEPPEIFALPEELGGDLAFYYTVLRQDGAEYTEAMRLRDLVYGTRYGAEQHIPQIAAGAVDISTHVQRLFTTQRRREAADDIVWNDISPLTELYTYSALRQTDLRLSDILPEQQVIGYQDSLLAQLGSPSERHMVPTLVNALLGSAPMTEQDIYTVVEHQLQDAPDYHRILDYIAQRTY